MQFFKQLTDPALKRLYKFVLKRVIGRFLAASELDLDQLDVHLRAGRVELCDLLLNADVLNAELCEANGLPFRVKKGYLGSVRVAISYTNIMSESCLVEIDDVEIVLVPLSATDDEDDELAAAFPDESKTAAGTKQTAAGAQNNVDPAVAARTAQKSKPKKEHVDEVSQEGLDFVASWIEQVTSKIKVTLSNVCLRLETGEQYEGKQVALECRLQWAQVTDESASEVQSAYGRGSLDHQAGLYASTAAGSNSMSQSMAASTMFGISQKGIKFRGISMDLLLVPNEDMGQFPSSSTASIENSLVRHPFLASDPVRQCYVQVKMSHYEALEAPTVDADIFFHSIRVVLQPQHFPEFGVLLDAFAATPPAPTGIHGLDRYASASMYASVCDPQARWLNDDDGDEDDDENGALNLSLTEFQRIEQILMQYRQTHEDLRSVTRQNSDHFAGQTAPVEGPFTIQPRKLSTAESVESVGLSDFEDDAGFFDCEPGSESVYGNDNMAASSMMGQSMYMSAMYERPGSVDGSISPSVMKQSTTAVQNRASRQLQNRFKFHLLECDIVLLYDDIPQFDDEGHEGSDRGSSHDDQHPPTAVKPLPSTDGQERLEFKFQDIICSNLGYANHSILSLTIGSFQIHEKMRPRMSMDLTEDESVLISTCVLKFVDFSPATGRKVHLSANLSAQLRLDFVPDGDTKRMNSLALKINAQPISIEWDMYLLNRAYRLMKLLEEPPTKTRANKPTPVDDNCVKKMDLTTECIQVALRFPTVPSDLIQFGPSSKRGLCEDKMILTIEAVRVLSHTPDMVDDDDSIKSDEALPSVKTKLPWLSEFQFYFAKASLVVSSPENGNQRSEQMKEAILINGTGDTTTMEECVITLRLQTPTREEIRNAINCKHNMSQDSIQHVDTSFDDGSRQPGGDDNDGGRVGFNGWNMEAVARTEQFESAAAAAALIGVELIIPRARIDLFKPTLDRLMVLVDALLMINPIDINGYNQMLASSRSRQTPSYMTLNVTLVEGVLKLWDYVTVDRPKPTPKRDIFGVEEETKAEENDENPSVICSYHFAFEQLKIFQVSQWLGQLVSRVHVSTQNLTLLEENDETKQISPVIYKTPFGVSKAPMVFVGIDIIDQTQEMREMKVDLHVSHASLRYDVTSKWLFQMMDMLLMEYPSPIIPLDSASMNTDEVAEILETVQSGSYEVVKLAIPPKTVFTKLFVNLYDALVDYAPETLESRVIVVLGNVNVSSNVVTGARMQGYKISATDLQLYLTHSRTGYEEIDDCILGNEMYVESKAKKKSLRFAGISGRLESASVVYPSLLTFLEKYGFLQIVTMDFIDVFLRSLVPVKDIEEKVASTFPELSVELNLGTANIYACFDSFNTLIELISTWTDQLAIEQEPQDTTAYVGLDRINDPSSVSVVTNLSSTAGNNRTIGTIDAMSPTGVTTGSVLNARRLSSSPWDLDRDRTFARSEAGSDRNSIYGGSEAGDRQSSAVSILSQIDENAFGGGKRIFPGTHVSTDTEARLLRTRLDEIQKQRDRLVNEDLRDDELTATQLRKKYRSEDQPNVRINELVIEDYYADSRSVTHIGESNDGASSFLMEQESAAPMNDPWFTNSSNSTPPTTFSPNLHPVGSLPNQSAVLHIEQAARWLPPSDLNRISGGDAESVTSDSSTPLFEPVEEKAPVPSLLDQLDMVSLNEDAERSKFDDESNEEDDQFPAGAFPAASKNWWGFQATSDYELSEFQTEGTEASFRHELDFLDEDHEAQDRNETNPMSMSFMYNAENEDDEPTEVELDFALDGELQSKFDRLMDIDSNDGNDNDGTVDDDMEMQSMGGDNRSRQTWGLEVPMSSPRSIPQRKASFTSTTSSHAVSTATSHVPSVFSPPDEPTARWFYDESSDGSTPTGLPSRIYPQHVEVPVGGSAASLSFGEKEADESVRSIARENAVRKVTGTTPIVVTHVLLRNFNICMRFFGGCDWTRDSSQAVRLHSRAELPQATIIPAPGKTGNKTEKLLDALLDDYVPSSGGDLFGDNSTAWKSPLFSGAKSAPTGTFMNERPTRSNSTSSSASNPQPSRKRSLKSGRKTEEMLELTVTRIQLRLDVFNEDEHQQLASSTVLALGDVEILDYISTSQIRKIICYWKSETLHPRESGSSMVHVHLMTVRPGPNLCEEHRLRLKILPLRINLDQEVVSFLRQFVPVADEAAAKRARAAAKPSASDDHDDDTMSMDDVDGTEMSTFTPSSPSPRVQETDVNLGNWFFQNVDVRPCKIKIDYRPNRVDYAALRAGDYLEVINLFVLEGMELMLRRVKMSGVDGWASMGEQVLMSWVNDISRHQIHKCVASVTMPPLRPFANIGSGAADLILLPMEHYGKDRRLVRGIKKGAKSFLKSVTIETLNTASKVAQGTQALLEHADDVMSSSSALRKKHLKYRQAGSRIQRNSRTLGGGGIRSAQDHGGGIGGRQYLTQQPSNATEGLYQAYDSLSRELHVAAKTIVAVPLVEYQKTGSQGYVRSVIRAVPVAVLRPMIGATEAMSKALIGVRNAVDPELKEDIENKFKDFRGAY